MALAIISFAAAATMISDMAPLREWRISIMRDRTHYLAVDKGDGGIQDRARAAVLLIAEPVES